MLLKDAKILIGDDSILARKQLKDILSSMGAVRFIEAVNGKETVEKYIAEKPDIIFLDIIMPIKDGITAVKEIIAEDPAAQIIIVSSVGTQQQLKSAIEAGAKDFIQKPINAEQIKEWYRLPKETVAQYTNDGILHAMVLTAVFDGIVLEHIDLAIPYALAQTR